MSEGEKLEQQGFEVNEDGNLALKKPSVNPEPLERIPEIEVKKEVVPEGCSGVKRSNAELGVRHLFTPMELNDENLIKISSLSKYGEETDVQLCSKRGTRGSYLYGLKNNILAVPVAEYKERPGSEDKIFLCCFVLNLDDGRESALVYRDGLEDILTDEYPYLFVYVKAGVIKDFSEKKINKLDPKFKKKYDQIKEDWDTKGEKKIKLFGYDD